MIVDVNGNTINKDKPGILLPDHTPQPVNNAENILNRLVQEHGKKEAMAILARASGYREVPPTIDEFLDDPEFLGPILIDSRTGKSKLYPVWREALREIYPNPFYSPKTQIIITGAIGLGKSTFSLAGALYDITRILHLENPQEYFGLIKSTQIVYALINATMGLAFSVLMAQIQDWISSSPYLKRRNKEAPKGHLFPNNIGIVSGSRAGHVLGKAVIGAILSEINFQDKVANQAKDNFTNTIRRMQSRFMQSGGTMPGHVWLDSSKADMDSFIESHIDSTRNDPSVVVYDFPVWKVKSHLGLYCGETFKVFIGDQSADPFIIERDEQALGIDDNKIIDVPIEYKKEFQSDIRNSLRDIAGVSTSSSFNFIMSAEKINAVFTDENLFKKEIINLDFYNRNQKIIDYMDFEKTKLIKKPRFIHIDIGIKHDRTGIACVYIDRMEYQIRYNPRTGDYTRVLDPVFKVEWLIAFKPLIGHETPLYKIREFISEMKFRGFPIAIVSTDGYQSTNLRQDLKLEGVNVDLISVDRNKEAYNNLRNAILEGRVTSAIHSVARRELKDLVENSKKIDHPATASSPAEGDVRGSKDLTDAMAGALHSCYVNMNKTSANFDVDDFVSVLDRVDNNPYAQIISRLQ